ncbi:membrane protein [Actinoplanes philippinensis]|uniref:Putative ABC transport system permease protein n=1 Tax=Actinoplanes philippinensis TaxID=35752 RepID=A0A1I2LAL4_9ACTN|nr:FtsX-like permease family protein [Actinoplanes philippinensis]GIE80616.1 membrane protein [Actinoplanes philippinensis]SFF76432.1 putative ABC transport system permease protein [Actinoplanes philippinensis]
MISLATRMLRHRPGSSVATLLALALGALILTAMGVLVESGLRYHPAPVRYAAADLVVARPDTTFTSREFDGEIYRSTVALPEGGTVPAGLAGRIRGIEGVATVAVDENIAVHTGAGTPLSGRGWASAVLTPYELVDGRAPANDDDVVLSTDPVPGGLDSGVAPGGAASGGVSTGEAGRARVGEQVRLVVGGVLRTYRISGLARGNGNAAAVFFSDAHAAALAPHRGAVSAVGVIAAPGTDLGRLADQVGQVAGDTAVLRRADSGLAERSADGAAAGLLIQVGASFGGYVILLIVFVVAATIGLSVRHRRRDLALVRAVAATPGQVRRMIMAESALVSVFASAIGVPAGLAAAGWLTGELTSRGFVPEGFPMAPGVIAAAGATGVILVSAVLAGLLAARRISGIKPAEALGEAAIEPVSAGRVRWISGLVALTAAGSSAFAAVAAGGQTALGAALGMLYLFVLAVALLAPWINAAAARLLAPLLRAAFGTSGYLAAANLRANARGAASVLTSLVLAVGFGGSVWFLQNNLERQAVAQSRSGLIATRALVTGAGLSDSVVAEVRAVPGVRAATPVRNTSVVASVMGDGEVIGARAVDPAGIDATLDLGVTSGSLADLRDGTAAVSRTQASTFGWDLGEKVALRLGDGTPADVRVVAIYEHGLGFGDVVLPRSAVIGHTATNLDDQILISAPASADVALREIAAAHPGAALVDTGTVTGGLAKDLALSAWLNRLLIAVMVGYTVVAAANTMVMAALARRRELAVLRLTGVTRRQVKRMINAEQAGLLGVAVLLGGTIAALTLSSVVRALTGNLVPYVPPLGVATVLGGTAVLALATTILPIARLLRVPPVEHIGVRE